MKNALILHGTDGNSQENWFPWLQKKLEDLGYQVWTPDLPDAHKPNLQKYNEHISKNSDFEINKETIIIGHSSGAVAIFGLLASLPEQVRVNACYLVGSFKNDLEWDALSDLFLVPFNFKKIKKYSKYWYFIHSDNDPYCPLEHAQFLRKQIGGELIVLPGQKHFSVGAYGDYYRKFPFLYHLIAGDAMKPEIVIELYQEMKKQGVTLWIDGGWGVDALLKKQTRQHSDLDVVIQKKDLGKLDDYLKKEGFFEIIRDDSSPYNYVLGNKEGLFVDIHVIEFDEKGNGIYGPVKNGLMYESEALFGRGEIHGFKVQCISPEWSIKYHSGYELRESDYSDVLALCKTFNIEVPIEYRKVASLGMLSISEK